MDPMFIYINNGEWEKLCLYELDTLLNFFLPVVLLIRKNTCTDNQVIICHD